MWISVITYFVAAAPEYLKAFFNSGTDIIKNQHLRVNGEKMGHLKYFQQ